MDTVFVYDAPVTGKHFIGRKKDLQLLGNLLSGGESVAMLGDPRSGRMSLVRQALTNVRMQGNQFIVAEVDFTKCRTTEDILCTFGTSVIAAFTNAIQDYRDIVRESLAGTHFVFDEQEFQTNGRIVSTNWLIDEIDIQKIFELPSQLASSRHRKVIVLIKQFQNICYAAEEYQMLKTLEKIVERADRNAPFVFTGSLSNAMRDIFEVRRLFWRSVVCFVPEDITPVEISEFIYRGFQNQGKVIEREAIKNYVTVLRCNMWYINQWFSILDSVAKGYVNNQAIEEALDILLSVHSPRFLYTVSCLTDFQLSMLRAIFDGEQKFSAKEVIDKYALHSSANVKRLKDALIKKEVVHFDAHDIPHIQDPLFEYWLRKYFG